jgi:hypothetical protein
LRNFWQRWRDPLGLHTRLEARRSRPRPEFVRQLADELNGSRRRARPALRLALAGALTLMMLVAAGTVGGASYAASAAGSFANAVTGVTGGNGKAVTARNDDDDEDDDDEDDDDPDDDQYEEEEEECELAVRGARQDFRAAQDADHRLFHRQNGGRSAHRAFHGQQENADRAQRRLTQAALEECDDIGGDDDDDDDDEDDDDD